MKYTFQQKLDLILYQQKIIIFQKESGRHLSAEPSMRKRNSHEKRCAHENLQIKQNENHYPYVFFNFQIFPFFVKRRRLNNTVCFIFSIINSNLLELQNFHEVSIPLDFLKFSICSKFRRVSGLLVFSIGFIVGFFKLLS